MLGHTPSDLETLEACEAGHPKKKAEHSPPLTSPNSPKSAFITSDDTELSQPSSCSEPYESRTQTCRGNSGVALITHDVASLGPPLGQLAACWREIAAYKCFQMLHYLMIQTCIQYKSESGLQYAEYTKVF